MSKTLEVSQWKKRKEFLKSDGGSDEQELIENIKLWVEKVSMSHYFGDRFYVQQLS